MASRTLKLMKTPGNMIPSEIIANMHFEGISLKDATLTITEIEEYMENSKAELFTENTATIFLFSLANSNFIFLVHPFKNEVELHKHVYEIGSSDDSHKQRQHRIVIPTE